jgi:hypothetical protein
MNPNSTILNSSDLDAKFGTPTLLPLSLFIEHEEKGQLCAQHVPPRSPRVHGKLIGQSCNRLLHAPRVTFAPRRVWHNENGRFGHKDTLCPFTMRLGANDIINSTKLCFFFLYYINSLTQCIFLLNYNKNSNNSNKH